MDLNNVNCQQTIDLDFGLIGGKVHGSLARAGKVKGQTPKVDKAEDTKKKRTGRAKRRIQYNRRFVNVVVGPGGRRKGPNANAGGPFRRPPGPTTTLTNLRLYWIRLLARPVLFFFVDLWGLTLYFTGTS